MNNSPIVTKPAPPAPSNKFSEKYRGALRYANTPYE
jgi:hypothetical protein